MQVNAYEANPCPPPYTTYPELSQQIHKKLFHSKTMLVLIAAWVLSSITNVTLLSPLLTDTPFLLALNTCGLPMVLPLLITAALLTTYITNGRKGTRFLWVCALVIFILTCGVFLELPFPAIIFLFPFDSLLLLLCSGVLLYARNITYRGERILKKPVSNGISVLLLVASLLSALAFFGLVQLFWRIFFYPFFTEANADLWASLENRLLLMMLLNGLRSVATTILIIRYRNMLMPMLSMAQPNNE